MIEELKGKLLESEREKHKLEHQLELLKRRLFGRSKERYLGHPELPFVEEEEEVPKPPHVDEAPDDEEELVAGYKRSKRQRGMTRIPDDLPEERTIIELPEQERMCPCCNKPMQPIGEDITEELEFQPASFFKRVTVRVKYACPEHEEGGVAGSKAPQRMVPGGMLGPGLLAQILTSKYKDHLPLHRQHGIYLRHGVEIPETTMVSWVKLGHELLQPVVEVMRKTIIDSPRVNSDDTRIVVQDRKHKGGSRKGFLWVYLNPELDAFFDYTRGRSRDGPKKIFDERDKGLPPGHLQVDAYVGYDGIFHTGRMIEVGCWAHARRGFYEAMTTAPEEGAWVLAAIRRLYAIEGQASNEHLGEEARLELRQSESGPLLDALYDYLEGLRDTEKALPESPLGKAITYAVNQREALSRFLVDASLPLDNNISERALRQVVVGRRNWLFAGSDEGAKRAATIYSVVVSCWLQKIDPFSYLRDVLPRLAAGDDPQELTPRMWLSARQHEEASGNPA